MNYKEFVKDGKTIHTGCPLKGKMAVNETFKPKKYNEETTVIWGPGCRVV